MAGKISGEVVPTNFGLKYNPPKLGIQYYFKENTKASFVHEINLSHINKFSDPKEISRELFKSNQTFLNKSKVSIEQVEKLVQKLQATLYPKDNKENIVNKAMNMKVSSEKP